MAFAPLRLSVNHNFLYQLFLWPCSNAPVLLNLLVAHTSTRPTRPAMGPAKWCRLGAKTHSKRREKTHIVVFFCSLGLCWSYNESCGNCFFLCMFGCLPKHSNHPSHDEAIVRFSQGYPRRIPHVAAPVSSHRVK